MADFWQIFFPKIQQEIKNPKFGTTYLDKLEKKNKKKTAYTFVQKPFMCDLKPSGV